MLLSTFENILLQNYNDFLLCEDIIIKLERKSHKYAKSLKCFFYQIYKQLMKINI